MASATKKTASGILPILGSFAGGSLYGWSGYAQAVRDAFEASHAATSMVFSIALVSFTIGVLAGPAIFARLFPNHQLGAIAGLAALCMFLAGSSPTFGLFVLSYGVGFGFASGALYNHVISVSAQARRPTLMVPVCVAAFGLGGAVFGASSVWLIQMRFGLWSNAPALVCLSVVALGAVGLGNSAEQYKEAIENRRFVKPNRQIVVLWIIFALGSIPGLIILGMAAEFMRGSMDVIALSGLAIFLAALGNTAGRLAAGAVATVYGPSRGVMASLGLSAFSLLALIFVSGPFAVLAALFFVALAYGHMAANMPLLVRTRVNARDFSTSFGWVFTGWGFAGLVGPWSAGWLLDRTGEFRPALAVCTLLVLVGLWLAWRVNRSAAPETGGVGGFEGEG